MNRLVLYFAILLQEALESTEWFFVFLFDEVFSLLYLSPATVSSFY